MQIPSIFYAYCLKNILCNKLIAILSVFFLFNVNALACGGSSDDEMIVCEDWHSFRWVSTDFQGSYYRELSPTSLKVDLNANTGGFDAGVIANYGFWGPDAPPFDALVDEMHQGFYVKADFEVKNITTTTGPDGDGHWWYGPKISVNWTESRVDWFENYVIENSDRTPAQLEGALEFSGATYIGDTVQNGSTYRHFRRPHSHWIQYYAIRQAYRSSGATSMYPIMQKWRADGMHNALMQKPRINIETEGKVDAEFLISNYYFPDNYKDAPNNDDLDGRHTLIRNLSAPNHYLSLTSSHTWTDNTEFQPLSSQNEAQQWVLEKTADNGNVYRIKNYLTGHYLLPESNKNWSPIVQAELNPEWYSQKWYLEESDGFARFRNSWTQKYLQYHPDHLKLFQVDNNESRISQRFYLDDIVRIENLAHQQKYLASPTNNEWDVIEGQASKQKDASQQWLIENVDDDTYRIKNFASEMYLQASSTENWASILQAKLRPERNSQKWSLEKSNGEVKFRNRWSGKYLQLHAESFNLYQVNNNETTYMNTSINSSRMNAKPVNF